MVYSKLMSLRGAPRLSGARGGQRVALDRLAGAICAVGDFMAGHPEISELDVNPLVVGPREVVALDARIVLDA